MPAAIVENKYTLRGLHQEIDLFDRKLAHMALHEVFASESAREMAERKMTLKREQLAVTARRLAADGIEFHASELPRSFQVKDAAVEPAAVVDEPAPAVKGGLAKARREKSAFAGTSLDGEKMLTEYMQGRKKAVPAEA